MLRSYQSIRAVPVGLLMLLAVNAKADTVNYLYGYTPPTLGVLTAPDGLGSVQVSFVPSVSTVTTDFAAPTTFAPAANFSMGAFFATRDTSEPATSGSFFGNSSPSPTPELSGLNFSGVPVDSSLNFASSPLYTGSFMAPTTSYFSTPIVQTASIVSAPALDITDVPETSSWLLAASGLLLIGALRKRAII